MKDKSGISSEGGRDNTTMVRDLMRHGQRAWSRLLDKRVPATHKLIPAAALAYLVSPLDLLPDIAIPGLGYMDDLLVLLLALKVFNQLADAHLARLSGEDESAIDAEYRVRETSEDAADIGL